MDFQKHEDGFQFLGKPFQSSSEIRTYLAFRISMLLSSIGFVYTLFFALILNLKLAIPGFLIGGSLAISSWLIHKKWNSLGKFWVIFCTNTAVFYYSQVLGREAGIYYFFFACSVLPFVLFSIKEKRSLILGIGVSVLGFLGCAAINIQRYFPHEYLPHKTLQILNGLTGIMSFVIVCIAISAYATSVEYIIDRLIRAASSIQESHQDLEKANTKLTSTLNELTKSNALIQSLAQQASLGAIIRGIAHEIKGPLTSFRACCSMILMSHNPEPEIKEHIEGMLAHVKHLGELSKTLLADSSAVARSDAPMDLRLAIEQVIKLIDNEAFINNIHIERDLPSQFPVVIGSAAYVSQAILNLMLNALQYTPRNGKIKVWVTIEETWVKIYISDSGCGIDPQVKDTLFEQGVTTATPGGINVGLGLHFVKRVVDAHKGTIRVHETLEEGTTFVMALPI